jgi:hypothetical protein
MLTSQISYGLARYLQLVGFFDRATSRRCCERVISVLGYRMYGLIGKHEGTPRVRHDLRWNLEHWHGEIGARVVKKICAAH